MILWVAKRGVEFTYISSGKLTAIYHLIVKAITPQLQEFAVLCRCVNFSTLHNIRGNRKFSRMRPQTHNRYM